MFFFKKIKVKADSFKSLFFGKMEKDLQSN